MSFQRLTPDLPCRSELCDRNPAYQDYTSRFSAAASRP